MRISYILPLVLCVALSACASSAPSSMNTMQSRYTAASSNEKFAEMAMEQTQHAQMWRAPKHPGMLAESRPQELWPTGIVESGLAPLPGSLYDIRNQYHETVGGRHVNVYASALRPSGEGVVVVITMSLDLHDTAPPTVHYTGTRAVRIESVSNGNALLREIQSGRTVTIAL